MTKFAVILEPAADLTRAVVIDVTEAGKFFVENVFEADAPNLDAMWALVEAKYPTLNAVMVNGSVVEADGLTVREAAEAAFAA